MVSHTPELWIKMLDLKKHPEGGYFKEVVRSENVIVLNDKQSRSAITSIYYLLEGSDFSAFHRIKSEEIWHYYNGSSLTLFILNKDGALIKKILGPNPDNLERYQICIPANCWFAAKVNNPVSYTLAGCTVAPGFEFEDFELGDAIKLFEQFPLHKDLIQELTR